MPDKPWVMRTYAGHSSAAESNALYRRNLAKGQTGLSVAFDLPTQTGYDPDHELSRGEVGKVGVPIPHLGAMRQLFHDIPLDEMNTSMTINATAMWLLAMYQVAAEEQGVDPAALSGTTQNDIIKEYLSRGTYVFGPAPSLRLTTDMIAYTVSAIPKWNPLNICSYHLQEAGATPTQELAYALTTAIAVLDAVRDSGQVPEDEFENVVGRISFFVNAGVRFVEEMCKMRAFGRLWDEITRERYGVQDPKMRRFRYGVQVNSLGLTEAQPENNVQRIVLEMLGVTLSKDARARAVQLPAWNEALGLPRPWDQQWSLRLQQVLAFESDLLEYDDIFEGSVVVEAKVAELIDGAKAEIDRVQAMGGAVAAVDEALNRLQREAKSDTNLMEATLEAVRAGATVGEWAGALREVFGEYRAPTGVSGVGSIAEAGAELSAVREKVQRTGEELGTRLRFLVGKPGLDGHSNGAEQIAVRARDAGFEVIYQGIRLTPAQIVAAAVAEDVHCVGLSILSGSHMELVPDVQKAMAESGIGDIPLIVGGIIPESDARKMEAAGVAAVFTPKDFGMTTIMDRIVDEIRKANDLT